MSQLTANAPPSLGGARLLACLLACLPIDLENARRIAVMVSFAGKSVAGHRVFVIK